MTSALSASMYARPHLHHRGFAFDVLRGTEGFAFAISHEGLALHASGPEYRTATSADRAARRFVDDALAVFDRPASALAA